MQDNKRDTDVKNWLLDSVGEGKGGMIWKDDIETCILLFPGGSDGKASVYNVRDVGSIPGLGRFPGEGNGSLYITICEIDDQSKLDVWNRTLKASPVGQPRGMGWGGRSGVVWDGGTHAHLWLIHVNVWQKPLQYCKVISLQLK